MAPGQQRPAARHDRRGTGPQYPAVISPLSPSGRAACVRYCLRRRRQPRLALRMNRRPVPGAPRPVVAPTRAAACGLSAARAPATLSATACGQRAAEALLCVIGAGDASASGARSTRPAAWPAPPPPRVGGGRRVVGRSEPAPGARQRAPALKPDSAGTRTAARGCPQPLVASAYVPEPGYRRPARSVPGHGSGRRHDGCADQTGGRGREGAAAAPPCAEQEERQGLKSFALVRALRARPGAS